MAFSSWRTSTLIRIRSLVHDIPKLARPGSPVQAKMRRDRRSFSVSSGVLSPSGYKDVVDLRSDTVTLPSQKMLHSIFSAAIGDDVMGEDPTVLELERFMAEKFGKERGLFVPTGTMSNLVALLSHCDKTRAAEIIIGSGSHINLWEGGNASSIGGIHTRQVEEDKESAQLHEDDILDCVRNGMDDHWPITSLLCLENSHNMCGGVALPKSYFDKMSKLAHSEKMNNVNVHVDGARIFNAAVAQDIDVMDLCENVDSISVCLSKGLGAPLGSVLVGNEDFITVAKRARKRCGKKSLIFVSTHTVVTNSIILLLSMTLLITHFYVCHLLAGGGMRQAGVVASMGLFAVQNNIDRLAEDHIRAKKVRDYNFVPSDSV